MTAIWHRDGGKWGILSPLDYPDEKTLHDLIEEAPQLLPLSGSPRLVVVGREVWVGGGTADLVAVEESGRLVIIEIKLRRNPEARRAVVAQVLTYAAFLKGMDVKGLESKVLAQHLAKRGHSSLADAAQELEQEETWDAAEFEEGLETSLSTGAFRLVVVLDAAPAELARLTAYLESISQQLTVDLIAVSRYRVGSDEVLVPSRVDADREVEQPKSSVAAKSQGELTEGADVFAGAITELPAPQRAEMDRVVSWARQLETDGLCGVWSFRSSKSNAVTLLPRLRDEHVGLATAWSNGSFTPWRSVFARRAPSTLATIDGRFPGLIGKGSTVKPTDEVLALVRDGYLEANGRDTGA